MPGAKPSIRAARAITERHYPQSVRSCDQRSRFAVAAVLVLPLLAVALVGYFALAPRGEGEGLRLAPGSDGGSFHPIAGDFQPDATELGDCEAVVSCLQQAFGNIAFRQGPKRALARFETRMADDPHVRGNCHRIVHSIGSASLKRFDGNVARTFAVGSATCVSGYYHGILERALLGVVSAEELAAVTRSLCVSAGMRRRGFLDYQCRHGLGHGLMIQTGYDLPVSLSICARVGTGWDRRACASGAFMENSDTRFGYRSRWLSDEDPLYPCSVVRAFDRRSCYLRASWRILRLNEGDYAKAADACARLGRWARTCFQGYGRDATEDARYAPRKTRELCRLAGVGEADCLLGAARTIVNGSGMRGVPQAQALCEGARASTRSECFSGMGLVLGMLYPTPAARQAACARVAPEYAAVCAEAARAEINPSGSRSWG